MLIKLLHNTPLHICSTAIRECWDSHDKSDTIDEIIGEADKALIDRIGNKAKHTSVKNHINYTFQIEGITTKTLLAFTRHDVGTEFSVQSTRYTTKKCVKNGTASYTKSRSEKVNAYLKQIENMIKECVESNEANDEISMLLPQAWNYNLVVTMSLSAVQHFLKLRLKPDAHWDIRELANNMLAILPKDHLYLYEDCIPTSKEITNG